MSDRAFAFGRFTFEPVTGGLRRGSGEVRLTPKAAAVLAALVARPDALLTKDVLFQEVWPGVAVSDAALTSCVKELRKALGDDARRPRYIETLHRRGYRFIAPVTAPSTKARDAGPEPDLIVGRERALAALRECLDRARGGERQIALVAGEPGIGKTTVVKAFLAGEAATGLLVGTGRSIEHYGAGEAYLPLLEALTRLGREPESPLLPVLRRHAPTWLTQMPSLIAAAERGTLQRTTAGATRERMLRELAEAVEALAATVVTVLWLEDLHWSDACTLDWLAYIARRPGPARLLVIGTYRPLDAMAGQQNLLAVRQELGLQGRCREISLDLLDEAAIAQYLLQRFAPAGGGSVPLGELARFLHRRTEGNPLFVASVIQDLIGRGVLAQHAGHWNLTEPLDALQVAIPDDIRGLIALQLGRLDGDERAALEIASVAGLEFSAAALAGGAAEGTAAVEAVCAALARREAFLVARGTHAWPDGTVAGLYAFRHWLDQQVVYGQIAAGRQAQLHRRIAERLAAAYGARADEVAVELAAHLERGRDPRGAIHYLHRAAVVASRRGAPREARAHLTRALELLREQPEDAESLQQEVALQIALAGALMATHGWGALEVAGPIARAQSLSERLGDTPRLFPALWGLWLFRWGRSELATAGELGARLRALAGRSGEPALALQAHHALWATRLMQGAPAEALEHARAGMAIYEPDAHAALASEYGSHDPGVCARIMSAWTLELLDDAAGGDRALRDALELAARLHHPFTEALALVFASHLCRWRGDADAVLTHAGRAMALSREQGFQLFLAWAATMHGWARAERGRAEEGIGEMRQAIAAAQASGSRQLQTYLLATLAAGCLRAGEAGAALKVVEEALTLATRTGERVFESELHRLDGEIRRAGGRPASDAAARERSPADCFRAAVEIARQQGARQLERRAAASLAAVGGNG